MPIGRIETLDHEARGVAHQEGKAIFIDDALPGETVEYASYRKKPNYEQARLVRVIQRASARATPCCPHFGVCGGCAMQHLDFSAQVAIKQRVLEDNLWHIGRVRPEQILPPIQGAAWGYRHKARLSVHKAPKKGGMLVGFHEKRSRYIADIKTCPVLYPAVSALLLPLRALIGGLSICERVPQVEIAVGDQCVALVLRILEPLTAADANLLRQFADQHNIVFYLQPKGPDTAYRFYPLPGPELDYRLPEFDLQMRFRPTDFTQVNHGVNRVLIRRALELLDPRPEERIVDLFCGLGNFTLPIARRGARAIGVEGNAALVERGGECARHNGLAEYARFIEANLFECTPESLAALGRMDKLFIDPPREGAVAVVKSLPDAKEEDAPQRIVYVSCNPATLARDAAILVGQKHYRFLMAGVINMFPHTAHVESIAVFSSEIRQPADTPCAKNNGQREN
jgi:23S rRNA (uracil1939-C5)-methyltransferase